MHMTIFNSLFCKEHFQAKKKKRGGGTIKINSRAENTGFWLSPKSNVVTTTKKVRRS